MVIRITWGKLRAGAWGEFERTAFRGRSSPTARVQEVTSNLNSRDLFACR